MSRHFRRWLNLALGLVLVIFLVGVVIYYASWSSSAPEAVLSAQLPAPEVTELPDTGSFPAAGRYCLACHQGLLPPRPIHSPMMQQILARGRDLGDPNGCVVCHGGTPGQEERKELAHAGVPEGSSLAAFTPVPGALQVNANTCGLCHKDHIYNVARSIMNTDAGKMKAILWSFGLGTENHDHIYGDHAVSDPDGPEPRFGSTHYLAYMRRLADSFPGQFPSRLEQLPQVDLQRLAQMPEQAAYTYLRNCNACHLSSKGYTDRGHARGLGCAACHSLYAVEGYYEGMDPSIDSTRTGHLMVHAFQGTRKSPITVHGRTFSGVQVSTCAACHAAGRRIGHAYQGLMAYGHGDHRGPFDSIGGSQLANAGYVYKYIRDDAHHRIDQDGRTLTGLLCQDCHTTNAMHGNGNLGATTLATIELECADCHGTPGMYPWELPLGYGDEFGLGQGVEPRGVAAQLLDVTRDFGMVYPREDGYLLSARGNPLGNVVRRGNEAVVHSATGNDFTVPLLRAKAEAGDWSQPEKAVTAMVRVKKHLESLECYACHSTWAPQYYGYKYVVDYRSRSVDWLASAGESAPDGTPCDYRGEAVMQPGMPTNWDYSHVRWEDPPLGINGEGRVSPLVGVIQTVSTVLDSLGTPLLSNQVFRTASGIDAMELQPLQPHTVSREARDCEDCHGSPQAMGYGADWGAYDADPAQPRYADVFDSEGQLVSRFSQPQLHAIADLHHDFMQVVDTTGRQVQTVDSHWPTSMPLTPDQRARLTRRGTCLACHQDIPDGSIPLRMLSTIAEIADLSFALPEEHVALLRQNSTLIAWIKAGGIVLAVLLVPLVILAIVYRRRIRRFLAKKLA